MKAALRVPFVAVSWYAVLIMSCGGARYLQQYVARDPSPGAKSVTVLPSTLTQADRSAADYLAGLLIECGVPVIARPSIVDTCVAIDGSSSSSAIGQVGSSLGAALSATGGRISTMRGTDPYDAIDGCRSEVVAITRPIGGDNLWIQFMSRESRRLLFSGSFYTQDSMKVGSGCLSSSSKIGKASPASKRMTDLLTKAGILK